MKMLRASVKRSPEVCYAPGGTPLYYLRSVKDYQSLAYPPRLAVDLGSYVDGEAHGWAW